MNSLSGHPRKLAEPAGQYNRYGWEWNRSELGVNGRWCCLDAVGPICKARKRVIRAGIDSNQPRFRMTTFDKREEGFEKQFAHDEELRFKATARRNKLLGLWAAEKIGLSGAQADVYAKDVVMSDFEEAGDHDVFRKIRKDFDAKAITIPDQEIRRMMNELLARAVSEIKNG
jgi:hypothetical protein